MTDHTTQHPGPFALESEWVRYAARIGRPLTEQESRCRAVDVYYDHLERGLPTGPMPEAWQPGDPASARQGF